MSLTTLEKLIKQSMQQSGPHMSFGWQGGETPKRERITRLRTGGRLGSGAGLGGPPGEGPSDGDLLPHGGHG